MKGFIARTLIAGVILAGGLISGCSDGVDIERRMIVSPVGIDAAPGGRFKTTIRMPLVKAMPAEPSSSGMTSVSRVVTAPSLVKAVILAQEQEEHSLFFGHCRAVVIGEGLAKRGVRPILDALYRHTMLPPSSVVVIARPEAEQVVNIKWPEVEMHDQNIRVFFEDRDLPCAPQKLWVFIRSILDRMEDPVVPLVEPSERGTAMRVLGAAVFRGDRAVGELNCAESVLYQILRNSPRQVSLTVNTGGKIPTSYMQVHGHAGIRAEWRDGRPLYTIHVRLSGNLAEYVINKQLSVETAGRLEKKVASALALAFTDLLRKLQSLGSDPLQLGNRLRIREPRRFSVKEWPARYGQADFRVAVTFRIGDLGKLR